MTKTFCALTAAGLTLTACAVPMTMPAPDPAPEVMAPAAPMSAKSRFVAAAEANGCLVNAETAPAIMSDATLSQQDLARIMTELRAEGQGVIAADGQSFRVTTGACAA